MKINDKEIKMENLTKTGSRFNVVALGVLILFFSGCPNPISPPKVINEAETGTIYLSINGQNSSDTLNMAKTIMPTTILDDFKEFKLDFIAKTQGNISFQRTWTNGSGSVSLATGTWELTVTAYSGLPLAEAAKSAVVTIVVTTGATDTVNVQLLPIEAGTGTFSWNIGFDGEFNNARMEIRRVSNDSLVETVIFINNGVLQNVNLNKQIPLNSGEYRVIFTLKTGDDESIINEVLHIYTNLISSFKETFSIKHVPVTLLRYILNTWDNTAKVWRLSEAGITAAHFAYLGITGVNDGNFNNIVSKFNTLSTSSNIPINLDGFKALVDAALVKIASENSSFLNAANYANSTLAEEAIRGLVVNTSSAGVKFNWISSSMVLFYIADNTYQIQFAFSGNIQVLELLGVFGDFIITGDNSGISFANNILTISRNGSYVIRMKDGVTETIDRIIVSEGVEVNITLVNVYISPILNATAFQLLENAVVSLTLIGENTLIGGTNRPGLGVQSGWSNASVVITESSTGSLIANSKSDGHGIWLESLTIKGGTIHATGGHPGQSSYGGSGISAYNLNITGGTVLSYGGTGYQDQQWGGSGIGGLLTINMSGGIVYAYGGRAGRSSQNYAVSGGPGISALDLNITGGVINAYGGDTDTSVSIFGKRDTSGSGIVSYGVNISGGTINATAGQCFGLHNQGEGLIAREFLNISGGIVTAISFDGGLSIGFAGYGADIVTGNAVIIASPMIPYYHDYLSVVKFGSAIMIDGTQGTMYGDVVLTQTLYETEVTIPLNVTLNINSGQTLTIGNNFAFTNNGTIIVYGNGKINGTILGNQPIFLPSTAGIGIGNPSIQLFMGGNSLEHGGITTLSQATSTFNVNLPSGTYTEITWYFNGSVVAHGATRTSITLSRQIRGVFHVIVDATTTDGVKNSGSHIFIIQ